MRTCVLCLVVWMNILHIVKSKREPSPAVQKLKATCKETATCPVSYAEDELKDKLTPLQYRVTQERGTERFVFIWERSGSVVECLTQDLRAAGSSLTGITALWFLSKTH